MKIHHSLTDAVSFKCTAMSVGLHTYRTFSVLGEWIEQYILRGFKLGENVLSNLPALFLGLNTACSLMFSDKLVSQNSWIYTDMKRKTG